ncbi:MAG: 3'-5' exonuclease [Paludibacteraceae bacterium]
MQNLQKILFIDIETVPMTSSFDDLSEDMQELWKIKFELLSKRMPEKHIENSVGKSFMSSAGIFAEFGKVICISVGIIAEQKDGNILRITSYANNDERVLLTDFKVLIEKFFTSNNHNFCGHNIKEFDIPYICRRMIINNIPLPQALNINGKKPWEVNLLDTLDFWKFGDYKNYTSLKLLSTVLGIPTSKDDIDGSQVASVYYHDSNLPRIVTYCQKDVLATAQVWLKMNGFSLVKPENVVFV